MDWTMVENADGMMHRLQTILYLLCSRYEIDAQTAGVRFKEEIKLGNQLCEKVINEMRLELAFPTSKMQMGSLISESEARNYLSEVLLAFDNARS